MGQKRLILKLRKAAAKCRELFLREHLIMKHHGGIIEKCLVNAGKRSVTQMREINT